MLHDPYRTDSCQGTVTSRWAANHPPGGKREEAVNFAFTPVRAGVRGKLVVVYDTPAFTGFGRISFPTREDSFRSALAGHAGRCKASHSGANLRPNFPIRDQPGERLL